MALAFFYYPNIGSQKDGDQENLLQNFHRTQRESNSTVQDPQCSKYPQYYYLEHTLIVIPQWAEAIFTAGNILVIIFAFCGNVAALFVLWKSRSSKKSTVLFLATLAVSDLLLVATSPPIELGQIMDRYHSWIYGSFLCKVVPFVQSMAVIMNSFCLLAIALERYLSVVCAFRLSVLTVKWQTRLPYIALLIMWLISIGTTLPNIWSYDLYSFWTYANATTRPRNETCETYYFCNRKPNFDQYNVIFYITLGIMFFSLLAGFVFCYTSILCFVKSHEKGLASGPSIRQRRTTYLVVGLIGVFFVCRVPVWIFNIVVMVKKVPQSVLTRCLRYSLNLLSNTNCVVQPFMYAIWNDSLRTGNGQIAHSQDTQNNAEDWSCCFAKGIAKIGKLPCFAHCCCKKVTVYDPNSRNDETIRSYQTTQKYLSSSKNEFAGLSYLSSESA